MNCFTVVGNSAGTEVLADSAALTVERKRDTASGVSPLCGAKVHRSSDALREKSDGITRHIWLERPLPGSEFLRKEELNQKVVIGISR